jgi:hypothetical protein
MVNNLLTPILNSRTRSVNFFNGRLLTGEDLTTEQKAGRAARSLLGQAIGSGVAYGLEVTASAASTTPQNPVLSITPGLAVNRNGGILLLDNGGSSVELALVRPAAGTNGSTSSTNVFQECLPAQSGAYVAGAGVYLLTIGPASAAQGLAEVSGVGGSTASCNSNYSADGVQFRLVQLSLTQAELSDTNHLQNLVAYKFFAPADWASVVTDPFGTAPTGFGLLDQLRAAKQITDCEVPLAVLYWTATGGLVFVDMWAVRRPVVSKDLLDRWAPGGGQRRFVEGLATFMQFQDHIAGLRSQSGDLGAVTAQSNFSLLPPAGIIPVTHNPGGNNDDDTNFFKGMTYRGPAFINAAPLEALVRESFAFPPIDTQKGEAVWLYRVRENRVGIDSFAGLSSSSGYLVFSCGHLPYQADARFDLAYWNYSNYALAR